MLTRVTKVLVGKDIARTSSLSDDYAFGGSSAKIAEGEMFVADKNKNLLTAGATIADTDTIYIGVGLGTTMTYSNTQGTSITARRIRWSDPIEGKLVKGWYKEDYSAKAEKVLTLGAISDTIVLGREYVLRIVYKDIPEHPGQFTKTYRYTATNTDAEDTFDGLRAAVNKDADRRITVSGTTTLIVTGKEIPECCTGLNDIDKFSMVDFDVYLNYVDNDGHWQTVTSTQTLTTALSYGSGNWEQIRDLEKASLGYLGITNQTQFPVNQPDFLTVVDETYNLLVIEHDKSYQSPDNQYAKQTALSTVLAIADGASQTADVLNALNPWMASLPSAFDEILIA